MKTQSLEELKDQNICKSGKPKRESFKQELWLKLIGEPIRKVRQAKDLAIEQLGELVGVQKS